MENAVETKEETLTFDVEVKNPESGQTNTVTIQEWVPEKGRAKNITKLIPIDFDNWTIQKVIDLWGAAKVTKVICLPKLMQILTNFSKDALTKVETNTKVIDGKEVVTTKEVDETDIEVIKKSFTDGFSVLSQRGESLQALTRALNELINKKMGPIADQLMDLPDEDSLQGDALNSLKELKLKLKTQYKSLKEEKADLEKSILEKKAKNVGEGEEEEEEKAA